MPSICDGDGDAYILPEANNKGNHALFQFFKAGQNV